MRQVLQPFTLLAVLVVALWLTLLALSKQQGTDFYPLYFASHRIVAGHSPYGAEATAELMREWAAPFSAAGVAYPLPLLLLVVPLAWLPFALATGVWTLLGGVSSFAVLRLSAAPRTLILLPFLFLPFFRGVSLGQATLIWFGLAAVMVAAIKARQPWLVGVTSALLLLKPQNGLLFALAGLIWILLEHRRTLWWFVGLSIGLWGTAFLLQPGWLGAWLDQIQLYRTTVVPPSLLPGGLLLIGACWRLPWWARIAAAQVVCFPLSDVYSALPLLFCWVSIGGPLALVGAGLSWIWSVGGLPNTIMVFWWLLLAPLMLSAVWQSWLAPRLRVPAAIPD